MFKEMNSGKKVMVINERINTNGFEFHSLEEHLGETIRAYGFLITNRKYGRAISIITETYFLSLPQRYVTKFENFNEVEREAVKNGNLVITNIRDYQAVNGRTYIFDLDDYKEESVEDLIKVCEVF